MGRDMETFVSSFRIAPSPQVALVPVRREKRREICQRSWRTLERYVYHTSHRRKDFTSIVERTVPCNDDLKTTAIVLPFSEHRYLYNRDRSAQMLKAPERVQERHSRGRSCNIGQERTRSFGVTGGGRAS